MTREIGVHENEEIQNIEFEVGPRKVLLLEGEDDLDAIETWYPNEKDEIYIYDCGGKDEVKILFDELNTKPIGRKTYAIRDRDLDFSEIEVEACYNDLTNRYFILRKRNLENYLLTPKSIFGAIKICFNRRNRTANNEAEVEAYLQSFFHKLKAITICNKIITDENNLNTIDEEKPMEFASGHPLNNVSEQEIIEKTAEKLGKTIEYISELFEKEEEKLNQFFNNFENACKIICGKRMVEVVKKNYVITSPKGQFERQLVSLLINEIPSDFRYIIEERILQRTIMNPSKQKLIEAEAKASLLFDELEKRNLIQPNKTEKQLNTEIFDLAFEMFGIKKYWHKRIVRAGKNTLHPYDENPENLTIQADDILFLDFGPIFEDWEADLGRTYVLGQDADKIKLKNDIEKAWLNCKAYFDKQTEITGAEMFDFAVKEAHKFGWEFGGEIAGHIIGHFPHERLEAEDKTNYIHPENHQNMFAPNKKGELREWILEIHFVDKVKEIGGFYERLMTV